jgi:hypothetical protein
MTFQTKHANMIAELAKQDLRTAYVAATATHVGGWILVDEKTGKSRFLGANPSETVVRLIAEDLLTARAAGGAR